MFFLNNKKILFPFPKRSYRKLNPPLLIINPDHLVFFDPIVLN